MRVVGSPAGCDASGWSAPCRNSSSASRFSPAHSRDFGFAIDQENFGSSGYGPSPHRDGSELFVRSPKECEGILIVGNAEGAERRDIEGVADVGEPVQTRRPPDCESRSGDRKADRQDERDPRSWRSLLRSN